MRGDNKLDAGPRYDMASWTSFLPSSCLVWLTAAVVDSVSRELDSLSLRLEDI